MPATQPLLRGFPTEIPYECNIFAASSTCANHIILHDLITIIIFGGCTNSEAPQYAISSSLLFLSPS